MSIIINLRKLLRLDKATLSLDTQFTDSVGLWINEKNEIMKEEFEGCLLPHNYSANIKHTDIPSGHHLTDIYHFPQDLHLGHF